MVQGQILIADDEAVLRLDLRAMLESLGHTIVGEADNGETAVYMARNLKPDLIILDIMMPRMNGLQAAEIIGKERLGAVMLLTAYCDVAMIEQANKAGVLGYLVKPFRQQELQPNVEIAISRYREMLALEGAVNTAQDQIETNRIIGRAKRVLMEKHSVGDQEAYRRLTAQSLATNRSLREISEAILLAEDLAGPSSLVAPRRSRQNAG
jgi:AmiR/NasT family two-component response regulator